MILSRRQAVAGLGAVALSSICAQPAPALPSTPALGLNTWSLRGLNHDEAIPAILRLMQQARLTECELLNTHAEPTAFDPDWLTLLHPGAAPATDLQVAEQKRKTDARTAWRLSVPLSYFTGIRKQFTSRGLTIRDYSSSLGSSAEEIDRVFLFATTLGATYLDTRVPEHQTDLAAAAAERHGISVGIQVTDPQLVEQQMRASPRLLADPDIGDLTKLGADPLEFVSQHLDRIRSLDLKDALPHGPSVPFGTGQARMRQVLELLKRSHSPCTAYIDCDYPGTGRSTEQVDTCLQYARGVLDA